MVCISFGVYTAMLRREQSDGTAPNCSMPVRSRVHLISV